MTAGGRLLRIRKKRHACADQIGAARSDGDQKIHVVKTFDESFRSFHEISASDNDEHGRRQNEKDVFVGKDRRHKRKQTHFRHRQLHVSGNDQGAEDQGGDQAVPDIIFMTGASDGLFQAGEESGSVHRSFVS